MYKIDDEYEFLTQELLEEEYIRNGLTDKQIADKYSIGSKATVWRRRKHYGIQNKVPTKSNKNAIINRRFVISKEDALQWQSEGKTYEEMAAVVGCSRMVLYRRIKELGLTDECDESMKKLKWHEPLTSDQCRFLRGDLLGDGSITNWGMYQCNHSHKQKAFIEYKAKLFSNLLSPNFELKERKIDNHQNGKQYRTYYLRTMGNENLKLMHQFFYNNDGVKFFPYEHFTNDLRGKGGMWGEFDGLSLAAWYMGDGGRKSNIPSLYTFGFGYWGNLQIQMFLKQHFDIESIMREDDRETRHISYRYYIAIKKGKDSQRFFDIVRPHMIPYFSYKLP